jgi:hypothetical protein
MTDPILIAINKHRRAREQHLAALGEAERICDDRIQPRDATLGWSRLAIKSPNMVHLELRFRRRS